MYWFTKQKKYNQLVVLLLSGTTMYLSSCSSSTEPTTSTGEVYFDIPSYFETQISSLQASNPSVLKSVSTNQESEKKEVQISDWNIELSSFLDVDLNKVAYQGYVHKDSSDNKITYQITNNKLDLDKVVISYKNDIPVEFEITKRTKNFLYKTDEILRYVPQKSYDIQKKQDVILLGINDYQIIGEIK